MNDTDIIKTKIEKYLHSRLFFRKRAKKLLKKGEKFRGLSKIQKMSLGLNNMVYSITINIQKKVRTQREYILRVYPDNENDFKPKKEYRRHNELTNYDIPSAKVHVFENDIERIGNRFMILDKLEGVSVQEKIKDFTNEETKEFLSSLAMYLGHLHSHRSKKFEYSFPKNAIAQKVSFPEYILMEVHEYIRSFSELLLDKEYKVDTHYVFKWIEGHKPLLNISKFSLIHGDVRPSNIIVEKNKITGLIDWEMSSYSDPAWDIGWSLFFFKLYDNLKQNRDFFFSEYWSACEKYDIEARVYFYEFLAALKITTYAYSVKKYNSEKYKAHSDFFTRVLKIFPKYVSTITHKD